LKEHKTYLILFLIWSIVIGLSYGVLVDLLFKAPLNRENQFLMEIARKRESIAMEIDRPKMVFSGGSATFIGVRTRDIQNAFGIPTLNLATHAKLGIDYILYRAKRVLRRGDIMILPLEYDHFAFNGDRSQTKYLYTITYDRQFFDQLPIKEKLSYLYTTPVTDLVVSVLTSVISSQEIRVYSHDFIERQINANGDATFNVGTRMQSGSIDTRQPSIRFQKGDLVETLGLKILKDFGRWCKLNGISFYITYANSLYFRDYESTEYQNYFRNLHNYFVENDLGIIGTPYDFFFEDRSLFYDTQYHLNQEGTTLRTRRLIQMMRDLDIVKAIANES